MMIDVEVGDVMACALEREITKACSDVLRTAIGDQE